MSVQEGSINKKKETMKKEGSILNIQMMSIQMFSNDSF